METCEQEYGQRAGGHELRQCGAHAAVAVAVAVRGVTGAPGPRIWWRCYNLVQSVRAGEELLLPSALALLYYKKVLRRNCAACAELRASVHNVARLGRLQLASPNLATLYNYYRYRHPY